jgi:transposase
MHDNPNTPSFTLFVGIDWADGKHDVCILDQHGDAEHQVIKHSPEAIEQWFHQTLARAKGGQLAIILEQGRGPLIHALMGRHGATLFPINPKQFANYRDSFTNSGAKSDRSDARLLAQMLLERHDTLRPWHPDDQPTRLLARLCEVRRQLVDELTRLRLQLLSQLKSYFPLALELVDGATDSPLLLEIVCRWGDPRTLRRQHPQTLDRLLKKHGFRSAEKRTEMVLRIRSAPLLSDDQALIEPSRICVQALANQVPALQKAVEELERQIDQAMKQHPDAALFRGLPGAGKALAPRLLCAFGSQRDRYASAEEVATFSGIAPATKQSGKLRIVRRRLACPKYLRQTFHEFANQARIWCPWSRAYYRLQRSRGMKHHAAIRKLASRWIRILFRIWQTRRPYDPARYLECVTRKNPEIVRFLEMSPKTT